MFSLDLEFSLSIPHLIFYNPFATGNKINFRPIVYLCTHTKLQIQLHTHSLIHFCPHSGGVFFSSPNRCSSIAKWTMRCDAMWSWCFCDGCMLIAEKVAFDAGILNESLMAIIKIYKTIKIVRLYNNILLLRSSGKRAEQTKSRWALASKLANWRSRFNTIFTFSSLTRIRTLSTVRSLFFFPLPPNQGKKIIRIKFRKWVEEKN